MPEKTADKIVIGQLNQFFSGEYERQNKIVEELRNQYLTITSALLEQISEWVNAAKAQAIEFDLSELEVYCKTLELLIGKNIELFESKKAEPSRSVTVDLSSDISKKNQKAKLSLWAERRSKVCPEEGRCRKEPISC